MQFKYLSVDCSWWQDQRHRMTVCTIGILWTLNDNNDVVFACSGHETCLKVCSDSRWRPQSSLSQMVISSLNESSSCLAVSRSVHLVVLIMIWLHVK